MVAVEDQGQKSVVLDATKAYEASMLEKAAPWVEMSALGSERLFEMRPVRELKPIDF